MAADTLTLLAEMPLFQDVDAAELSNLGIRASLKTLEPGQTLFDQSDNSKDVYFLISGRLLAVHITVDGREMIFGRTFFVNFCPPQGGSAGRQPVRLSSSRRTHPLGATKSYAWSGGHGTAFDGTSL